MISLGFDASSTVVGYAFTEDKKILDAGFVDISKVVGNREKAWFVIEHLKTHFLIDKIEQINLEGSLAGFSGPSSRTVVIMLARWNAILEYVLGEYYGKKINLIKKLKLIIRFISK